MAEINDNTLVLDQFYGAFNSGDVETAFSFLSPNVKWISYGPADRIPFAGTFHGHSGVREFFKIVEETIELIEMTPEKFVAAKDEVFGVGTEHSRSLATGDDYRVRWSHIYQLENGKITRFEEFLDSAAVADALS